MGWYPDTPPPLLPSKEEMRWEALTVASRGSEVPSGSSAVYHNKRLLRDLIWLTWSVTELAFWYVLSKGCVFFLFGR